jgi:hypothetical protein
MPKFHVRLESQTDHHAREVTLSTDTEAEARAICEEKERDLCAFQLPADQLEVVERDHSIDPVTGKVKGPVARAKANLHAHYQSKPYKIVSVRVDGEDE